jgi:hypothetical protein
MLSAVVQMLREVRDVSSELKLATINLCALAFPDIQPWQVQEQCLEVETGASQRTQSELTDVYYVYLCRLLNPAEGHEAARRDASLVKEWCELSVRKTDNGTLSERPNRLSNFDSIASRTTSTALSFKRDLVHLLGLGMEAKKYDLALDLGELLVIDLSRSLVVF